MIALTHQFKQQEIIYLLLQQNKQLPLKANKQKTPTNQKTHLLSQSRKTLNTFFFWPWTPTSFTGWALILYFLPSTVIAGYVTLDAFYVGATAHVPAWQNLDYSCTYCSGFHRLYKNTSKLVSFLTLGLASYPLWKRRECTTYQISILRCAVMSDSSE